MRLKLRHPELLRTYRKVLTLFEEKDWKIEESDGLGRFLWMDIPDYIIKDSNFKNHSQCWDAN